ncbi:MAG TPA: hypothetical protein PKC99_06355 [Anaerolineales bacterium]|jgi:hypothetical protein|nr:hypothetical protein [Anaerolineales bacterium]MBL1170840.1 hypothetical protein [Chloroflexota bacterium]MBN8658092.1 hypothetical protein [Anaerolineae bacterium]RJP54750.1 MAG: hypothetical protein C4583_01750 [Anaerolineaceae bacterium]MBV6391258.1 hypothetical protein [Anaerolineales bacterium]
MGRTLVTITQLLNETEANLSAFRRTLRRSDQYVFDGLFAAARRHIAAIGQAESLLPFESALLAMLLEQSKEIAVLEQKVEELIKKNSG